MVGFGEAGLVVEGDLRLEQLILPDLLVGRLAGFYLPAIVIKESGSDVKSS